MSWVAVGTAVASMVISYAGSQQAASAQKAAGEAAQQQANFQAEQMRINAGQEEASAQRKAHEATRRANMLASRAIAAAGAGGGGVTDPTVINLIADIQGEGAYRHGVAIYEGEENARQLNMGADAKTYEGNALKSGADSKARATSTIGLGSLVGSAGSIYGKFGAGGSTNYSGKGTQGSGFAYNEE